jgi:hypothetical protein
VSNSLSFPFQADSASTGSTSFGSAFTYAVAGDWGGRPYQDLENCFTYVSSQLGFVDTSRAIAAGGSYGGYMMNFIAGQPLAKKFKTLICHDGIFNFVSMLALTTLRISKTCFIAPRGKPSMLNLSMSSVLRATCATGARRCCLSTVIKTIGAR